MRIVLATGIYPPDIGGTATYCAALTEQLRKRADVQVITYSNQDAEESNLADYSIVRVRTWGGPLLRWRRYAKALKHYGENADVVVAFSSVSVGIPLIFSQLKNAKRVVRLGGDFFWERYTDSGGVLGLREWHGHKKSAPWRALMRRILRHFDWVVYSTSYQQKIHEQYYALPKHCVIENALPSHSTSPIVHAIHTPLKLLYFGRFVGFKNLLSLVRAMSSLPAAELTLVGSGPQYGDIAHTIRRRQLADRVKFCPSVGVFGRQRVFDDHDALVVPSITEISPNTALEARAAGLPVLLTHETGLSPTLTAGMVISDLSTPHAIVAAVTDLVARYDSIAQAASSPPPPRNWETVTNEWMQLFSSFSNP